MGASVEASGAEVACVDSLLHAPLHVKSKKRTPADRLIGRHPSQGFFVDNLFQ